MPGRILELGFEIGGPEMEMAAVHVGTDVALRLGISTHATLRLWAGTPERKERMALVEVMDAQRPPPAQRIRISPRMESFLGVRQGQVVFVEDVRIGPCLRASLRPLGPLPLEDPTASADYVKQVLRNRFHVLSLGLEIAVAFPGAVAPTHFRVEAVEPPESAFTNRTELLVLEATPLESPVDVVRYDEIGGLRTQLRELRELLEFPLRRPQELRRLGIAPCRGVLLYGPPGTGKSLMVRALSAQTGAHVETINGPEILSGISGGTEEALRSKFEAAAEHAPAIVLIDEVDAIAPRRDKNPGQQVATMVAQLLTLMDGLNRSHGVVVVGTTNRVSQIDPALRRPGRFAREIHVPPPDVSGRLEILRIHAQRMPLAEEARAGLGGLADRTHGFVGADLMGLCFEAGMSALRRSMDLLHVIQGANALGEGPVIVTLADFEDALNRVGPSALRETSFTRPDVRWSDIGGYDAVKRRIRELVELPLKHPERFDAVKLQPAKGLVLYGPPGTGKTMFAKAIASECEANMIVINGPEIFSKWFGESEERLREFFQLARNATPCIIFVDEIDALLPARGQAINSGLTDSIVNQFLAELDGIEATKGLVVIGATNRIDRLDPAVLRPGRLGEHIEVGVPDLDARRAILALNLEGVPLDGDDGLEGVLNGIAQETEGFSGAQLAELVNQVKYRAIREATPAGVISIRVAWLQEELQRARSPRNRPGYRMM